VRQKVTQDRALRFDAKNKISFTSPVNEVMSTTMKISHLLLNRFINSTFISKMRSGTSYMFRKHLLLTNIGISASIGSVGDCIEQNYEKYKAPDRKYDVRRTLNMSAAGVTTGAVCHYWYIWLDRYMPGRTFRIAMKKVIYRMPQYVNGLK